jgi:MarR family transcriptional regulator for hemolysin
VPLVRYDFEESVGYWVVLTARAFRKALNEQLAPHGITLAQWQVVGWLATEGELSQADLAARMEVEPPTLTGILERMEQAGWIGRRPCPGDRRKRLVRLEPSVGPVWSRIVAAARRVRGRAARGIGPSRIRALRRTLEDMRANLEEER